MSLFGLIAALLLAPLLVGVLVTSAFNALDRNERVRPTAAGAVWMLRELLAGLRTLIQHPFGMWVRPPRHLPPPWPAERRRPVVLVPGFALNGSSMWALARHLRRCGWDWVHIVNNEPRVATVEEYARSLAVEVERLRAASGAHRVDLVAHSMGGVVSGHYINHMRGAEAVNRLVTLGTPWHGTRLHVFGQRRQVRDLAPGAPALALACPPQVALTSIWSRHDGLMFPTQTSVVPGADNRQLQHIGHLDLLYNPRALSQVAEALATPVLP